MESKGKKQDYTRQKIEIEKKKEHLLRKKIKDIGVELKNLVVS